jgi:hypothetical protein
MRCVLLFFCLFLVTACDESFTGPTVPLNREFELGRGQAARIEDASLAVKFDGVTGDSRCPADAFCIQGGDAIVGVTAVLDGRPRAIELHTGDMRPAQVEDLTIALVQVLPYPFSSRTIGPDEYRVTLKVMR